MKLNEIMESTGDNFSTFDEIGQFLKKIHISLGSYGGGGNGGCYAGSEVDFSQLDLPKIPVRFRQVYTKYDVSGNNLHTLEDCSIPPFVSYVIIDSNPIKSLVGIDKIIEDMTYRGSYSNAGKFDIGNCPIEKGGLGLMLIKGIRRIESAQTHDLDRSKAFGIIQKAIDLKKNIFDVQEELIEAGLERFAEV